jgi:hypothetical protein
MTGDDIIRMAKNEYGIYAFTAENLAHFAALVAAAEREACAKVCEDGPIPKESTTLTHIPTLVGCAAAIRARGEQA